MSIEAFLLPATPSMTVWQFLVGSFLGVGVGITLSRSGIMVTDPKTRWLFISLLIGFASLWGIICGLLNG